MSQTGIVPQIGMNIKNYLKPPPSHGYFSVFSNSYWTSRFNPNAQGRFVRWPMTIWKLRTRACSSSLASLSLTRPKIKMGKGKFTIFIFECFLSGYHWDVLVEGLLFLCSKTSPTSPQLHCNSQARKVQSPAVAPGDQLKFNRSEPQKTQDLDVSENRDTPKSSI